MKILLINPNTSAFVTRIVEQAARRIASPETEIVAVTGLYGVPIVGGRSDDTLAAVEVLRLAETHGKDCDAVVLAISFDSGLQALREKLSIPVVGMTEAAVHIACMTSGRFAMVTFGNRAPVIYIERCQQYGVSDKLGRVMSLPNLTQQEKQRPELIVQRLADAARQAIEQDQVEAIILSGAIFANIVDDVASLVNVPVLNGVREALGMAEMLVKLKLHQPSVGSFQPPELQTINWPDPDLATPNRTEFN